MGKIKIIPGLAVLFFFTAVTICFGQQERPALVKISDLKKDYISDSVSITGNLYFETTGNISAELSGKVEDVFFNEGDYVKKGDILLKADTVLLETQLKIERAELQALETRIEKIKKDLERYEDLFRNNAASEASYDEIKFSYEAYLSEKQGLAAKIEMTEIKIEKSSVYSPFDGLILEKNIEKGAWVQPGTAIFRIGKKDTLSVKVPVSEKFIRFSKAGDLIDVYLTAEHKNLKGRVIGFMPYADPKTRNLYLKIGIDYDGPVAENMSCVARVSSSEKKEVFLVSRDALTGSGDKRTLFAAVGGKAVSVNVDVSGYMGEYAAVLSDDLNDGMSVVVEGNERLAPGQSIEIIGEK